ncbi:hypothetical protein E6O75_ATG09929 [Venturia nashicola]|uniref:Uncharacterized protein n=1 Tax=Venturia nashicola TaxID=86259 RepID=A0A4Z1NNI4_9PEZI|nr:hypothetical protein E6O75_ATG09929 [Venturia nashicola]
MGGDSSGGYEAARRRQLGRLRGCEATTAREATRLRGDDSSGGYEAARRRQLGRLRGREATRLQGYLAVT